MNNLPREDNAYHDEPATLWAHILKFSNRQLPHADNMLFLHYFPSSIHEVY